MTSVKNNVSESDKIRCKYPNRVPVILVSSSNIPQLKRSRYLVPNDITTGQFLFLLRQRLNLSHETAMFMYVGKTNVMPPSSMLMGACYLENKDQHDGFMYGTLTGENCFGYSLQL